VNRWVRLVLALALMQAPAIAARAEALDATRMTTDPARAAYVASMEGRKADALAAAQELAAKLRVEQVLAAGGSGWMLTPRYTALVRFGLWDELIALLPPDARLPGLNAGYLYARGVAFAARGQLVEAHEALADLERLGASGPADADDGRGALRDRIAVAAPVVAARIAATELRNADAVRELEKAAAAEDRLAGDPGAGWFFPVRDLLGAQLLISGRAAEAVHVYREDLERHPRNGWALYGLAAALRARATRRPRPRPSAISREPGSRPTWLSCRRRSGSQGPIRRAASVNASRRTEVRGCRRACASGHGQAGGEFLGAQHKARVD
jgi:tetratricopeptide (TPR) repeat protein